MECAESSEELAILLQETVDELKQQRELNKELKALIERNSRQLAEIAEKQPAASQRASGRSPCSRSTPRVTVSLQTKNLVHSVYKNRTARGDDSEVLGWNFTQRFESASNQEVLADIKREIGSIHPEIEQAEISSACKTYFRSLKDDNRRESRGVLNVHRKDLKVRKRIKQKLKRRQSVLIEASQSFKWPRDKETKVKQLLSEEYMSSETSAEESETDENSYKVRDIPWLRKRYRKAFHALDKYYSNNKMSSRSKKMTRLRVKSNNVSERSMPETVPEWAVDVAYRNDENSDLLNSSSISSESYST